MTLTNHQRVKEVFASKDLSSVFLEVLGWDSRKNEMESFQLESMEVTGTKVASLLGGVVVFLFKFESETPINRSLQNDISRAVGLRYAERLVILENPVSSTWLWPKLTSSGALTHEKIEVSTGEMPLFLAQRLSALAVSRQDLLSGLTIAQVRAKLRGSFDSSKVTKKFFDEFKKQHESLAAAISGLSPEEASSYATLLLNRLMFVYFLQKKEFLNSDANYLQSCLASVSAAKGDGQFYNFYKDLLLVLFFDRLNSPSQAIQDAKIARIIGDVPYINGGIFGETDLEKSKAIAIPDQVFADIFVFFDAFTWHLDTRPTGKSDEINPEVIGYIFEQYINFTAGGKKENGAYYTKGDVTGYMVGATLVPRILDVLVELGYSPLSLVRLDPTRYIFDEMLKGYGPGGWLKCSDSLTKSWLGDPSGWTDLDSYPADPEYLLDNETWVEMFHRRNRVDKLVSKLGATQLENVSDMISHNLNCSQLLLDYLQLIDESESIEEIWDAISELAILDPTCGSGAFLFGALETLESVYGALLDRALDLSPESSKIIANLSGHPNHRYFIRKHAASSNLFGTDLMPDAIETAKLRIFLALVSCLESPSEIEPLPDLDFNLKSGNLVTGFLNPGDVTQIDGDLLAESELLALQPAIQDLIVEMAQLPGLAVDKIESAKATLVKNIRLVSEKASRILWNSSIGESEEFSIWQEKVRPMHWFIEFPKVIARGGFDVVIGNPPYIGKRSYTKELQRSVRNYRLANAPDFYAVCYERSLSLLAKSGRHSFVVMLSLAFSEGFGELRRIFVENQFSEWWSTFGHRPDGLFTGPGVKNTILTLAPKGNGQHTTQHNIFDSRSRSWLFKCLEFSPTQRMSSAPVMRGGVIQDLIERIAKAPTVSGPVSSQKIGVPPTSLYWMPVLPGIPPILNPDLTVFEANSSRTSPVSLHAGEDKELVLAVLAGKLGFAWWSSTADNFDVAKKDTIQPRSFIRPLTRSSELDSAVSEVMASGKANLIQTLYAGKLLINIRWSSARSATDKFDRLVVESMIGTEAWRDLNIWYRKAIPTVLESPGNTKACEAELADTIWLDLASSGS